MRLLISILILVITLSLPLVFGTSLLSSLQSFLPIPISTSTPAPTLPQLIDSVSVIDKINQLRQQNLLTPLQIGQKTCQITQQLFNQPDQELSKLLASCSECKSIQIANFSQPLTLDQLSQEITQNSSISGYFLSTDLTHICVATSPAKIMVALVSASKPVQKIPSASIVQFTEDQLWEALSIYRQSQGRSTLQRDENVCQYARKRVQDHLNLIANKTSPDDYPVKEKYPLDAHQGFKTDADSGYVFEITQKNQVAENLAYWPNAQDPIHVIEWGWDTSTEGHREAQLNNDWTHACLSGKDGFFVAIFAK